MVEVKQNLMALPGVQIEEIKEVYSHPQGFAQSSAYLENHPDWRLIPYFNTSRSAKMVAEAGSREKACIAGERSAKLYGLTILADSIQDYRENYTRFALIAPIRKRIRSVYTLRWSTVREVFTESLKSSLVRNSICFGSIQDRSRERSGSTRSLSISRGTWRILP